MPAHRNAAPRSLDLPILRCARGDISPNVALMHMAREARDATDVERALSDACARVQRRDAAAARRLRRALDLWRRTPAAFGTMTDILRIADAPTRAGTAEEGIAHWASVFDRAAEVSPEASVALYSLGNPDLLDAATTEVVDWMHGRGLLADDGAVLEIGCGIGRFIARLARSAWLAVGIDVSQRMIDTARRRCAHLPSAAFVRSSGRDLSAFRDGTFDLVYSVDTFPYLVQLGGDIAAAHIRDAARVLRPGGRLLILNYSYRGDAVLDRRDVAAAAGDAGLALLCNGTREFTLWDGAAFLMARS
ncbi:MAG: class I SAM-dependent methyltransferase [Gemmatimonas sp.]